MSFPWCLIVGGVAIYYVSDGISTIKKGVDDIITHVKRDKSTDSSSTTSIRSVCAGAGTVGTGLAVVGIGCWLGKVALMKPKAAYQGMLTNFVSGLDPVCAATSLCENCGCAHCGGFQDS